MVIGMDEQGKTLDEAINFNQDNIFDYLHFILHNRNVDDRGDKVNSILDKIYDKLDELSKLTDNSHDVYFNLETSIEEALCEVAYLNYDAGFREACRLQRTLNSF